MLYALSNCWNGADPEIHKNWNTSSDIDLVDSKDGGNLQQELALAYGQLRKSVTGEGSSFFKAAEERAKSRHELTRADKDVSWTNLDPKERARLVRAEKSMANFRMAAVMDYRQFQN